MAWKPYKLDATGKSEPQAKAHLDEVLYGTILSEIVMVIVCLVLSILRVFWGNAVFERFPATLVGSEGLEALHSYLSSYLFAELTPAILFPVLVFMLVTLIRFLKGCKPFFKPRLSMIVLFLIAELWLSSSPYPSQMQAQMQIAGVSTTFGLLREIEKDMESAPIVYCTDAKLTRQESIRRYRIPGTRHSASISRQYLTYTLADASFHDIAQLSRSDYEALNDTALELSLHTVKIYPNSHVLYCIDDEEVKSAEETLESLFTLSYGEDGYLRRSAYPEGISVENLTLNFEVDSMENGNRAMDVVDEYPPLFYDGHENKAYLTMWYHGAYVRVSNVVTVTEVIEPKEYEITPPELTGTLGEPVDGKRLLTIEPLGVTVMLPEDIEPDFMNAALWEDSQTKIVQFLAGENREMSVTMQWEEHLYYRDAFGRATNARSMYEREYEGVLADVERCGSGWTASFIPGSSNLEHYVKIYYIHLGNGEFLGITIAYDQNYMESYAQEILESVTVTP